ncbi:MAG: ferredoxin [Spirochaetes bacterium]|nr:ferredoxin [Spirochaetota bacterium]
MADKTKKILDNVPGKYYVDENCIGCNLCVNTAPSVFAMNSDEKAFVQKQPEEGELQDVQAALESCPVSAIGDDGT